MQILNYCFNKKITTAINAANYVLQLDDFKECVKQLDLKDTKITPEEFILIYSHVDFPFSVKASGRKNFFSKKTEWFQPGRPNVLMYNVKDTADYSEVKHFKNIVSKSVEMLSGQFKEDLKLRKNEFDKKFTLLALTFAKKYGLLQPHNLATIVK